MATRDETRIVKTVAMPAYLWDRLEVSGAANDRSVTGEINAIIRREFSVPDVEGGKFNMTEKQQDAYAAYLKAREIHDRTLNKDDAYIAGKAWGAFMRLYEVKGS